MGGKPCIRGMRVAVGASVVVSGHTSADILKAYPYLEEADKEKWKNDDWFKTT